MTRERVLAFLRQYRLAVEATVAPDGAPQAAVVGFAVSDGLELVFDTLTSTRKYLNLRADPRIALVIGWEQQTAQIEGVVDFPTGAELTRIRDCYFVPYPDGRDRLVGETGTSFRVSTKIKEVPSAEVPILPGSTRPSLAGAVAKPGTDLGHEVLAWPGITHARVRPTWLRYSDFSREPPLIVELSGAALTPSAAPA